MHADSSLNASKPPSSGRVCMIFIEGYFNFNLNLNPNPNEDDDEDDDENDDENDDGN